MAVATAEEAAEVGQPTGSATFHSEVLHMTGLIAAFPQEHNQEQDVLGGTMGAGESVVSLPDPNHSVIPSEDHEHKSVEMQHDRGRLLLLLRMPKPMSLLTTSGITATTATVKHNKGNNHIKSAVGVLMETAENHNMIVFTVGVHLGAPVSDVGSDALTFSVSGTAFPFRPQLIVAMQEVAFVPIDKPHIFLNSNDSDPSWVGCCHSVAGFVNCTFSQGGFAGNTNSNDHIRILGHNCGTMKGEHVTSGYLPNTMDLVLLNPICVDKEDELRQGYGETNAAVTPKKHDNVVQAGIIHDGSTAMTTNFSMAMMNTTVGFFLIVKLPEVTRRFINEDLLNNDK